MIDLHIHTYYSNGLFSPQQVVEESVRIGLQAIAITDHDNIDGNIEARPFAEQHHIELVPAVEVTTRWGDLDNLDIMAYFVDFDNVEFRAMLAGGMQDLANRMVHFCQVLTQKGYPITYDELIAQNPRYAGTRQIIEVLQNKGFVKDFVEAFPILKYGWSQIPNCALDVSQAIQTINDAGGVAVLAHPPLTRSEWFTIDEIKPLVDAGLGGIEVYHPSIDEAASDYFIQMAKDLNVVITGGSDEHGFTNQFTRLGKQPVTIDMLETLRERATT